MELAFEKKGETSTKFPIKAPETMPRQGTKGAPNWALKQQHRNKFPDGGSLDYLALTKLTGSETGTFDNRPILRFTLCVNCSLVFFSNETPDAYSSQKVPKRTTVNSNMPL